MDHLGERILLQKKNAVLNDSSARKYLNLQDWSLNFRDIRGKFKNKVPDVSDSNQNIETSCKSRLKLCVLKHLYVNIQMYIICITQQFQNFDYDFLLSISNTYTVTTKEYYSRRYKINDLKAH